MGWAFWWIGGCVYVWGIVTIETREKDGGVANALQTTYMKGKAIHGEGTALALHMGPASTEAFFFSNFG